MIIDFLIAIGIGLMVGLVCAMGFGLACRPWKNRNTRQLRQQLAVVMGLIGVFGLACGFLAFGPIGALGGLLGSGILVIAGARDLGSLGKASR